MQFPGGVGGVLGGAHVTSLFMSRPYLGKPRELWDHFDCLRKLRLWNFLSGNLSVKPPRKGELKLPTLL